MDLQEQIVLALRMRFCIGRGRGRAKVVLFRFGGIFSECVNDPKPQTPRNPQFLTFNHYLTLTACRRHDDRNHHHRLRR
ncbi:hypothetical protein C1H46_037350 [Malus baccata]|uniref:Uncharacterized protein n=1 Tax=Malus baccata TaxID=106549 RepID=A0A540KSC1_MALBA|nr:hypothetical protein C1H46_037350 [Malus baccata]